VLLQQQLLVALQKQQQLQQVVVVVQVGARVTPAATPGVTRRYLLRRVTKIPRGVTRLRWHRICLADGGCCCCC
jgi:hypothetical protein